jgi:hypothetical protein
MKDNGSRGGAARTRKPIGIASRNGWMSLQAGVLLALLAQGCAEEVADASLGASLGHASGCAVPEGIPRVPRTVDDVVAIMNALPEDASVACFLETLQHPLHVQVSSSFQSLQPSVGDRSPRIFLVFDPLVMSVVPAGVGRDAVELTVQHPGFRSVKAEIKMPTQRKLTATDPYESILLPNRAATVCSTCHSFEEPFETIPGAFISTAFRPRSDVDFVPLQFVRDEAQACDPAREPERCAILTAIFNGEVIPYEFPEAMPLFQTRQ